MAKIEFDELMSIGIDILAKTLSIWLVSIPTGNA
jgi:hypothetical protein